MESETPGPADVAGDLAFVGIGKFLKDLAPQMKQGVLFSKLASGPDGTLLLDDVCAHAVLLCQKTPGQLATALVNQGYDLSGTRFRWRNEDEWLAASVIGDDPATSRAGLRQLVAYMNKDIRRLNVSWRRYAAAELTLSSDELELGCNAELRGVPAETLRTQAAFLLRLNKGVAELLPTVDFRGNHLPKSMASVLSAARDLLLHELKSERISQLVDETAQRQDSTGAPEISLDPLTRLEDAQVADTHFVESMVQLDSVDPVMLRVKMASGGDPVFPLEVRFTGEKVDGTSGSFRDFLGSMAVEIRDTKVPLFMKCPSSSVGRKVGLNIMRPGPMSFPTARMLEYFGQLIGIALRADIPFPIDALPCFWKTLAGAPLSLKDIADADFPSASALDQVRGAASADELAEVVANFEFDDRLLQLPAAPMNVPGEERPTLAEEPVTVTWETKTQYLKELESLRYQELGSSSRMGAVLRGLKTVMPLDFLSVMTWEDLDFKVCGPPDINLAFLKANTTYSSGLSESDPHIAFFWKALRGFSSEELQTFVKFACNQERIPSSCRADQPAAPPYPMKIANPDHNDSPDGRLARCECCMFMIKLPHYTTQKILTTQLRKSMETCDDPLSH
jgi:E3 ubiquitin-protein ligase HECTD4